MFSRFLSIIIYYQMLNALPCVTEQDLDVCAQYCMYGSPKPQIYPPSPLVTISLFSVCVNLFLFCT